MDIAMDIMDAIKSAVTPVHQRLGYEITLTNAHSLIRNRDPRQASSPFLRNLQRWLGVVIGHAFRLPDVHNAIKSIDT